MKSDHDSKNSIKFIRKIENNKAIPPLLFFKTRAKSFPWLSDSLKPSNWKLLDSVWQLPFAVWLLPSLKLEVVRQGSTTFTYCLTTSNYCLTTSYPQIWSCQTYFPPSFKYLTTSNPQSGSSQTVSDNFQLLTDKFLPSKIVSDNSLP